MSYLIDANILITPYKNYYAFDLTDRYWEQLKANIEQGNIVIIDRVKAEVVTPNPKDDLALWLQAINFSALGTKSQAITNNYGAIMKWIMQCGYYDQRHKWLNDKVADPWLIACAITHNHSIVSAEQGSGSLGQGGKSRNPKLPDVAAHFNVQTTDLYTMMRDLSITL